MTNSQRRLGLTLYGHHTQPPAPEAYTAADIPHLGILPDAIHQRAREVNRAVVLTTVEPHPGPADDATPDNAADH